MKSFVIGQAADKRDSWLTIEIPFRGTEECRIHGFSARHRHSLFLFCSARMPLTRDTQPECGARSRFSRGDCAHGGGLGYKFTIPAERSTVPRQKKTRGRGNRSGKQNKKERNRVSSVIKLIFGNKGELQKYRWKRPLFKTV